MTKGTVVDDGAGRPTRMIGVNADMTELRVAESLRREEAELRASEARLRELADAMPQVVFAANAQGHVDYFNGKWYELTGTTPPPAGDAWTSVIHPDDRAGYVAAWLANVRAGRRHEHEARFWSAETRRYRWHLTRALPVHQHGGGIVRWYGTHTDIDDRKRVEQELRESEAQLRALGEKLEHRVVERTAELSKANAALREEIQVRLRTERTLRATEERFAKAFGASPDAVSIMQQADGRTIEVNRRWEHLFRCRREDVIGRPMDELSLFADQQDALCVSELIATQGGINELELDLRRRDGSPFRGVVTAERVEMGGEPCIIVAIRDITDQRRAEYEIAAQRRQLAHLGRVALLGELSGALAHELNQPLAAILANARAAQRMLAREAFDTAEVRMILDDIVADDRRAGAVISRVRAMIRKSEAEMHQISVNDIVLDVLDLARSDLRQRGVAINSRWSAALPLVRADRVQLQQVVLNLIVNACDAMMELPPSERRILVVTSADDDAVRISVADRGVGIAPDALEAVFQPFVTSKAHGLGLGLSICRSIVDAHGGRLWATNNDDRGATFHVRLPAATEMSAAVPA